MENYKLLDTQAFDHFISAEGNLKKQYSDMIERYNTIVSDLMKEWKGDGAEAFEEDAKIVMTNITGIGDILSTMCDTLNDCREIFGECDTSLGKVNRE